MDLVSVSFLGAGDAFTAGGRHQAAYLVQGNNSTILLDCGATTLASLKRDRIDTAAIDVVFISHLHGDHFAGLPFLFLHYTYEELRDRPLQIAGPPGTQERVSDLFRAMYRESAGEKLPFDLDFIEMRPESLLHLRDLEVEPFRVPHQEKEISLGMRIALDGKRVLYSGDTGWTEDLIKQSLDTDLFICECCFFETRLPFHLDYPRLEENHNRFGAQRLILTHLGREVLARRSEIQLETADDGLIVQI